MPGSENSTAPTAVGEGLVAKKLSDIRNKV